MAKSINTNAVEILSEPKLKNPLLIAAFEGWNDGGMAATNTVRKMVEVLGAKKFASIDPEDFFVFSENRPQVFLADGVSRREIKWQENDFYHAALPGANRDVVLFVGTEPNLKWRTFCENFASVVQQFEIHTVVTLGAFLADALYTLPVQVNGFSSDEQIMEKYDLVRTNYEGPTGIVGVINGVFQEGGLTTLSLWAAVPYYISIPNPKAVHALAKKLKEIFEFDLDLQSVEIEAESFDNEINDIVSKDPNIAAYVRELKKREFLN